MLTNTNGDYFCTVTTKDETANDDFYPKTFVDTDVFEISLCHNQSDGSKRCEMLDDPYEPVKNSKEHNDTRTYKTHAYIYVYSI